jgi:hypothetical protein
MLILFQMARNLDDQLNSFQNPHRGPTPQPPPPPPLNYTPGFAIPGQTPPMNPAQPLQQPNWSPWSPPPGSNSSSYPSSPAPPQMGYTSYNPQPYQAPSFPQQQQGYQAPAYQVPPQPSYQPPRVDTLTPSLAALSFSAPPPQPPSSPPKQQGTPSLTATLPTIPSLSQALPSIQQPSYDPASKIAWCRDVIFLVDRMQQTGPSTEPPVGPARITDPQLQRLVQFAVPLILQMASPQPMPSPMPLPVAEAIYLRATFAASGAYPEHVRHSPRSAFRDFEQAARGGYATAWFRLGRDYENFNDFAHAKDCFERGVKQGVESCCYVCHLIYFHILNANEITAYGHGPSDGSTRASGQSRASRPPSPSRCHPGHR